MGLLCNDLDNFDDEGGDWDLSAAADRCIQRGVYPLNEVRLNDSWLIDFSSRKTLAAASGIARTYVNQRFGCTCNILYSEEYETRGKFTMSLHW